MIIPHKNWCVPPDTIRFGTPIEENIVVCKGSGCTPSIHNAPYDLAVDTADIVDGKVTIRFGYDSRHLHEWKIPAFASKFTVTKYDVHAWVGEWLDSDGQYYILYGYTNDIPSGVVRVVLIDKSGNVYYAEAPSSENDFAFVGTVNDIVIAIQNHRGKNIVSTTKIAWWIPVLIAIGLIGGSGAAVAYFNMKSSEEKRKAVEAQQQTVNAILDFCERYPDVCRSSSAAFMEIVTSGSALMSVSGGSNEGRSWISKLWNAFQQWIAPLGMLIGVIIMLFKFNVIVDALRSLREAFRRR